ncbi:related to Guanine nucleotide-binding protein subunit alpha [Cephalotrichum gorgonifer]|uniref:Related to Guanine nucleotide-binding protein subunit alpha n=1 Tax=Cephalotrichum gorgonifer TaxID=2041049 RepID=A0AAE8N518_9PEZI|nr:related to Guanine nucleotide-binding protein subunit alpha [Cephalotrichum gorgonifer]
MATESVLAIIGGRKRHAKKRSEQIDLQLKQWRRDQNGDLRILVLGPSRSGKSTLIKQMEISYEGISDADRERYKPVILGGIVESMRSIITAGSESLDHDDLRPHAQTVLNSPEQAHLDTVCPETRAAIELLWADERVQHYFGQYRQENGSSYTSMDYFFGNLARITSSDYSPTDQDILHTHVETLGIRETTLNIRPALRVRVSEVGTHHRGEGLFKGIHYFDDARTILIMVPLSSYFELGTDKAQPNRLDEARRTLTSLVESKWFEGEEKRIVLVFNEVDKFKEMLPRHPLADFFPDYEGGEGYKEACQFIAGTFTQRTERRLDVYYCCATDVASMEPISQMVIDSTIPTFRMGSG